MTDGFEPIQEEISWAKSRLEEAGNRFKAAIDKDSFAVVRETDPNTGNKLLKLKLIQPPPAAISHLLRGAMKDLKDSFDRSLHVAARTLGNDRFKANYPWTESVVGLKSTLRKRQMKPATALPIELIREIFRQKPYVRIGAARDQQTIVREVAKFANLKHSLGIACVATAGSYKASQDIAWDVRRWMGPWDVRNNEMVIFEVGPEGHYGKPQVSFSPNVFFERGGEVMTVPALTCLLLFAEAAERAMLGFRRVVLDSH